MQNPKVVLTDPSKGDYFYREAIKTLRANVTFSGKKNKKILLTSVFSGEGKSDTTFHLAAEMANSGKRVLLIDADIRNSVLMSRYKIKEKVAGLSEYLSGQVEDVNGIICATNYENLYMIMSGPYAPNPAEMLGDEQFRKLLEASAKVFDYVFIDTPPLGEIIDAAMVGQYCDGAVIVIESGAVSRMMAQRVKNQLAKSGCHILGVVLNKVERSGGAYGRYGRYGKYGKYGRYGYGKYGRYGKYGKYGHYGPDVNKMEEESVDLSDAMKDA